MIDLVGEPAAAPPVGGGDGGASGRDLCRDRLDLVVDGQVVET